VDFGFLIAYFRLRAEGNGRGFWISDFGLGCRAGRGVRNISLRNIERTESHQEGTKAPKSAGEFWI
jgi:hypothetical protein